MKYLKTYEYVTNYGKKIDINSDYVKIITEDECFKLLKETTIYNSILNGSIFTKKGGAVDESKLIFRAINHKYSEYGNLNVVDPKIITRYSPYANNNLYNLTFSNIESWKDLPKRNQSLICGDYNAVRYRGNDKFMIVIPFEPKVVVCPSHDIWSTFNSGKNATITASLDNFFSLLKRSMSVRFNYNNTNESQDEKINDKDWSEFVKQLERFDKIRTEEGGLKHDRPNINTFINNNELKIKYKECEISTLDVLNILFNPKEFEVINYDSSEDLKEKVEMWTDSKSLLIDYQLIHKTLLKARELYK